MKQVLFVQAEIRLSLGVLEGRNMRTIPQQPVVIQTLDELVYWATTMSSALLRQEAELNAAEDAAKAELLRAAEEEAKPQNRQQRRDAKRRGLSPVSGSPMPGQLFNLTPDEATPEDVPAAASNGASNGASNEADIPLVVPLKASTRPRK